MRKARDYQTLENSDTDQEAESQKTGDQPDPGIDGEMFKVLVRKTSS